MNRTPLFGLLIGLVTLIVACVSGPPVDSGVSPSPPAESPAGSDGGSAAPSPASALDTTSKRLPVDPLVTVGTLANGLTYYIRENSEPRNRAFLRLAVNVGSILEDEDQLGLAHFVEHMAFNGTQNYSGNEIIAFLERLGMQFGPDVNAYTGFDETVYELTVPTDDDETFRQAFSVLLEWAARMTMTDEEIEKERGGHHRGVAI